MKPLVYFDDFKSTLTTLLGKLNIAANKKIFTSDYYLLEDLFNSIFMISFDIDKLTEIAYTPINGEFNSEAIFVVKSCITKYLLKNYYESKTKISNGIQTVIENLRQGFQKILEWKDEINDLMYIVYDNVEFCDSDTKNAILSPNASISDYDFQQGGYINAVNKLIDDINDIKKQYNR